MRIIVILVCLFMSTAAFATHPHPVKSEAKYTLITASTLGGFYGDIGGGWLFNVPVKASRTLTDEDGVTVRSDDSAVIDIDSPFVQLALGYHWKTSNIFLEANTFGVPGDHARSITTLRIYKRWYFRVF